MGRIVKRRRGDKSYVYFVNYFQGNKIEVCCGLEGRPETKEKADKFEYNDLFFQKQEIERKMSEMSSNAKTGKIDDAHFRRQLDKLSKKISVKKSIVDPKNDKRMEEFV